jgi:HlyD family secretion protein
VTSTPTLSATLSGADAPEPNLPAAAAPVPAAKADLPNLLEEPSAQAWYLRHALWGTLLVLLLLGAGLWYWQASQIANAAPSYVTQTVAAGDLTVTVSASGTTTPTRAISIGSELSGTVLKVNADINDKLRNGQLLVELDPAKLNDQILRSRATLASANAKVAQTVATTKEATATLERFEEVARLSGGKVPAKSELDTARATLDRARADEASARAAVNDAQAALSTDEINLSKSSIRAPSDGVVLTRNVDPGNAVAASLQAVTLFTIAEDLAQLRVVVYVDEADVGSVAVGQTATFTVSAYPTRKYPARITRVAFGSNITDNVVTYMTDLAVDNTDLSLRPGMTAVATIITTQRHNVLLVPNSALRFAPSDAVAAAKPAASGGIVASLTPRMPARPRRTAGGTDAAIAQARQVWVLRDGSAVPVAVTPGVTDGRMTEISGGDLQAGMLVITDQKSAPKK